MNFFRQCLFITGLLSYLGTSFNNGRHIGTELLPDKINGNLFHILNGIMKHGRRQYLRISDIHLFRQNFGDRTGMHDIGLTGSPPLIIVGIGCKIQGIPKDMDFGAGVQQLPHLAAIQF